MCARTSDSELPLGAPEQPVVDDLPWSYEDEEDARAEDRAARREFEREAWPSR